MTREKYLKALQALMEAIPVALEQESIVYIPLIGAGAGNVGTSKDIVRLMEEMLRFNRKDLRQEIHVVVNEKYKDQTPIYQLPAF